MPIVLEVIGLKSQSVAVLEIISKLCSIPVDLLRYASSVDAGATQLAHLNNGYTLFVFRCPLCSSKSATACTYDN